MSTVHTSPSDEDAAVTPTSSAPTDHHAVHPASTTGTTGTTAPRLRETWPIHRHQLVLLVSGWAVLTAIWIGLGELVTGPLDDSAVVRTDRRVANWMVDRRTPTWNDLTLVGSYLSETITKVVVTTLLALVLLKVWRRWLEPLVIAVSLVVEAAAFITVTAIVGRQRPDVPRLDGSPVDSSFPSGHVAAAAVYTAIAVVVFWHTQKRWTRVLAATIAALIPFIVALSRMYRGMHFLTDTIAGAVLGFSAVALTVAVLSRAPEGARARESEAVS